MRDSDFDADLHRGAGSRGTRHWRGALPRMADSAPHLSAQDAGANGGGALERVDSAVAAGTHDGGCGRAGMGMASRVPGAAAAGAVGAGDVAAAAHTHRGRTGSGGFIAKSRSDAAARGWRRTIYWGTAGELNSMDCRAGHCRSCTLVARPVPDSPGWNPPVPQRIARGARDARFADVRVLRSARVLSAGARDGARTIADDRGSRAVDRLNRMDLGIVDAGGMRLPFRFQRAAADHAIRPACAGDRYRRRGRHGGDPLSARRRDRRMGSRGPRDGYLLQHEHRALDPGRDRPFSRDGILVNAVDRLAGADARRRVRGRGDDVAAWT